jgi:hypothetical protein
VVIFVILRALLAARVRWWRVVFVFLARVVGGRCVGAAAALRFFSGARCARASGAGCVCFCGARRGLAVRACCWRGLRLFFWRASRAGGACVLLARAEFVFLARVAGGRCVGAAVAVRFVFLACVAGWWRVRGSGAGYVCFSGARRGRAVFVPCSGAAFFFLGRASRAVLGRCLGACFFPCVRLGRAFSSDYGARWASPASKTTGDRSPCASRIKFIFEIFFRAHLRAR